MFDALIALFDSAELLLADVIGGVHNNFVSPLIYSAGLMSWSEGAYDATAFFVGGVLLMAFTALVCIPLERIAPVHTVLHRAAVRVDVVFTMVSKLGIIPLLTFSALYLAVRPIEAVARMHGFSPFSFEDFWPALAQMPALNLLLYVLAVDFAEYWFHRFQHRFGWWWQLHSLHHSQREMTFWTDDRNHIVDQFLSALWLSAVALAIGMPPEQFPFALAALKFVESLSHANVRWGFGPLKHLLVSPQFHRVHHGIGVGHEGKTQGVNFGVAFTLWDKLFGTADFRDAYPPTGVRDQLEGRNYGTGFWETQWLGFSRLKQHFLRH